MATFRSLEDLAALKKEMKREKEAKAKQTISAIANRINRSSSACAEKDSDVCVHTTSANNAIYKNELKKLTEIPAPNSNSSSPTVNVSADKLDKKSRRKLMRKLERQGLSKNAIKSQLRPCLTWNEDLEKKSDVKNRLKQESHAQHINDECSITSESVNRTGHNACNYSKQLSKTKVCVICGKKIKGEIVSHFREKHFSFYAANQSLIESHPGAVCISIEKYNRSVHLHESYVRSVPQKETPTKVEQEVVSRGVRKIIEELQEHPQEQTYRGLKEFECDSCFKMSKHGKVIFVNRLRRLHLCYACYNQLKAHAKGKRGNKHVFINTPM